MPQQARSRKLRGVRPRDEGRRAAVPVDARRSPWAPIVVATLLAAGFVAVALDGGGFGAVNRSSLALCFWSCSR